MSVTPTMTPQRIQRGQEILAIFARAAETGAPCPTNDEIADLLDLYDNNGIVASIGDLRASGAIIVKAKGGYRSVIITETGKATGWTARPKQYVGRNDYLEGIGRIQFGSFRGDLPPERYVDRNPCCRCGVRADIGCRHSRSMAA